MTWLRFLACLAGLASLSCTYPMAEGPAREGVFGSSPAPSPDTFEGQIYDLINAERRHQGLPNLAYNAQLDRMAGIQAGNMAYFQKMAHVIPEAKLPTLVDRARSVGYPYATIAENVALGYPTPAMVVEGWMNSRGHRENILDRNVVETGIAVRRSREGGLYYCQVFGRRRTSL